MFDIFYLLTVFLSLHHRNWHTRFTCSIWLVFFFTFCGRAFFVKIKQKILCMYSGTDNVVRTNYNFKLDFTFQRVQRMSLYHRQTLLASRASLISCILLTWNMICWSRTRATSWKKGWTCRALRAAKPAVENILGKNVWFHETYNYDFETDV